MDPSQFLIQRGTGYLYVATDVLRARTDMAEPTQTEVDAWFAKTNAEQSPQDDDLQDDKPRRGRPPKISGYQ